MKKTIFRGAGVALVTPMNSDGSVNYAKLKELVDFQIENATDAIIVCGTTGESSTLDEKEHLETIRVVIDHTAGRVPVIAGTGSNDTAFAIQISRDAANLGADGLLSVTPYYNKTSQAGLVAHFTAIADAVDCPMILYNVPSRTGTAFQTATYAKLAKHPNIVGIKEANANLSMMARTFAACGDDLDIYSGNDDEAVPCLALGGAGVISVLSNIAPRVVHDMCYHFFEGRVKESRDLQVGYVDLIGALFSDVNPIPVKEAMNLMGMNVGPCRLPLVPMSDEARENLKAQLAAKGLLG